jgi:hypothetical protein
VHHTGCNGNNYAALTIAVDRDFAVAVITNAGGDSAPHAVDDVQYFIGDVLARDPAVFAEHAP